MTKQLIDIFQEINDGKSKLEDFKQNFAVRNIIEHAFDTRKKFDLPEGIPPFNRDKSKPGMSPANLYQAVKKLYIFTRVDLSKVRREQLFIQMIESVHSKEADLLLAIKDQIFESMYPNINSKEVIKHGFVEKGFVCKKSTIKKEEKVEVGRNLNLNFSDAVKSDEKMGGNPSVPKQEEKVEDITPTIPKRKAGRPRKVKEIKDDNVI